jgi:hypothetical protein
MNQLKAEKLISGTFTLNAGNVFSYVDVYYSDASLDHFHDDSEYGWRNSTIPETLNGKPRSEVHEYLLCIRTQDKKTNNDIQVNYQNFTYIVRGMSCTGN